MCVSCKQAENNINVSIELDGLLCTSISGSIKKTNYILGRTMSMDTKCYCCTCNTFTLSKALTFVEISLCAVSVISLIIFSSNWIFICHTISVLTVSTLISVIMGILFIGKYY